MLMWLKWFCLLREFSSLVFILYFTFYSNAKSKPRIAVLISDKADFRKRKIIIEE